MRVIFLQLVSFLIAAVAHAQGGLQPPSVLLAPSREETSERQRALSSAAETPFDAQHTYTLAELINIGELKNPGTRAAWNQVRAQAAALGIAKAELYPALAAVLLTNTARNQIFFNSDFYRQTTGSYEPLLELDYLVLDFGGRSSRIKEARERLWSSQLAFDRTELDVAFQVEARYFAVLNSIGLQSAAQENARNADLVSRAVDARLQNGLATLPDALEARAAAKQANVTLEAATGAVDIARGDLLTILGGSPLFPLQVEPLARLTLPGSLVSDPKTAVTRALVERPELGEYAAQIGSARAELLGARSSFLPTLEFTGNAGGIRSFGQQDQLPSAYKGLSEVWNAGLTLRWNFFEGGRRTSELARDHASLEQAQAAFDQARDDIEQQVWTAFVRLRTAVAQREAADELLASAQASYDASLRSYQLGLRSTVDLVSTQRTLAQALSNAVSARTDLLTQQANFSYRTGDLLYDKKQGGTR